MMLNEAQIKAALVDRLIERKMLQDAVLINEMVVANWSRRADIAVANGRLHAFEIKSDFDSLRRLDGQISSYLDRFDKVTVVTTKRFMSFVLDQLPANVEIWEARPYGENAEICLVRKGRIKEVLCHRALCGFLLKTEIVSYLRQQGFVVDRTANRDELVELVNCTPTKKLREFVLFSLKSRYRDTFEAFMRGRSNSTQIEDLDLLSKSKQYLRKWENAQRIEPIISEKPIYARKLNLDDLALKYGPLPENMPKMVIIRKRSFP